MSKTLVIAEKPSVGRDLAGVLPGTYKPSEDKAALVGDDYVITWAVGHLVGLAEPDAYDAKFKRWRYPDLPIVPKKFKLVPNDDRAKKQLTAVHKLIKDHEIERIVNACDAGREGELIFAYLYETSKTDKPVERLWLNSMTKKAIEDAFGELRPGEEMNLLEAAARSRNEADWLVGMNATRAATIRLRSAWDGAVSLGRVQTPTLALVARREQEIRAFVPEPYWLVEARFAAREDRLYSGRYLGGKRIAAEDAARIVEETRGKPGEITKLEKKEERERPQLLYDLTSLQRNANNLFGFSARRTLAAAQKLYEDKKAITYPRTSSRFLPSDMIGEIKPTATLVGRNREYAQAAAYVTRLDKLPLGRVVNDKKVSDHHAIIPTKAEHDLEKFSDDERKIYDLVAKRFLAVFHPEAVFERTRIETTVAEHVFRTSGRVLVEAGWKSVYGDEARPAEAQDDDTGRRPGSPTARAGRERRDARCRVDREGDAASSPLLRGLAPRRHGNRGQGHPGRRAARGHEGLRDRNAGDARLDHRAADPGRLHRARRACPPRDREGHQGHRAPGSAPAHLAGADGKLGAPARPDRAGRGQPSSLHGRHRRSSRRRPWRRSTS